MDLTNKHTQGHTKANFPIITLVTAVNTTAQQMKVYIYPSPNLASEK